MSDPIARLRGIYDAESRRLPAQFPWRYADGCVLDADDEMVDSDSGALIVSAVNSLPALLAVAELAQRMVNLGHDGEAYNRTFIDIEEALAELADATRGLGGA